MREGPYKTELIKRIRLLLPGCIILKNDADYMQGVPDLTILYGPKWAWLEVKVKTPTRADDFEPNQEWYIEEAARMSFGACIYPQNEEEVLHALQRFAETPHRPARVSQRKQERLAELRR